MKEDESLCALAVIGVVANGLGSVTVFEIAFL